MEDTPFHLAIHEVLLILHAYLILSVLSNSLQFQHEQCTIEFWVPSKRDTKLTLNGAFTLHTHRPTKGTEWIKLPGLDYKPFPNTRGILEERNGSFEVASARKSRVDRKSIEERTKKTKKTPQKNRNCQSAFAPRGLN